MLVQYLRAVYIPSLSGRTFQMLVQYLRAVYIYPHYQGGRSKCYFSICGLYIYTLIIREDVPNVSSVSAGCIYTLITREDVPNVSSVSAGCIYIPSLSGRTFQMLVQYLRAVYIYPHYQGGRSKC